MSKKSSTYFQRVHALDLATGANRLTPVNVVASFPGTGDNSSGGRLYLIPSNTELPQSKCYPGV